MLLSLTLHSTAMGAAASAPVMRGRTRQNTLIAPFISTIVLCSLRLSAASSWNRLWCSRANR